MSAGPLPGTPEHRRLMTASKAASVLWLNPWHSGWDLWHEMAGRAEPKPTNDAMRRGHYLEPAILAWWRDQHPDLAFYREQEWFGYSGGARGSKRWAGCAVDAYIGEKPTGRAAIVEAKSAASSKGWGKPGTDEIPGYYMAQVLFQLALTGADRCYVAVIGPYMRFAEYVIPADPPMQQRVLDACRRFYDSLGDPEPPAYLANQGAA